MRLCIQTMSRSMVTSRYAEIELECPIGAESTSLCAFVLCRFLGLPELGERLPLDARKIREGP